MHPHERCYPKLAINKERDLVSIVGQSSDDTRHQVANDDQIANANPEAFDCDGRVEHNRRIWVGDLRQSKERRGAPVKVSRASGLQVQAEPRGECRPDYHACTQEHAH